MGAVLLFEGLLGSAELPELIAIEPDCSFSNLNICSAWQFCISRVKVLFQHLYNKHLIPGAL